MLINDFFGIQMSPKERAAFKIVSYNKENGVSYASTVNMNPEIYAWAELAGKEIQFKVVNGSSTPVSSNYLEDQFSITLNGGQTIVINKGRSIDYPVKDYIKPKSEANFTFVIPEKFWETIGMTHPQSTNESYTKEFWAGLNTINTQKENIDHLNILLGGKITIVLKLVPHSIHEDTE